MISEAEPLCMPGDRIKCASYLHHHTMTHEHESSARTHPQEHVSVDVALKSRDDAVQTFFTERAATVTVVYSCQVD